jgi:hypothetical protein
MKKQHHTFLLPLGGNIHINHASWHPLQASLELLDWIWIWPSTLNVNRAAQHWHKAMLESHHLHWYLSLLMDYAVQEVNNPINTEAVNNVATVASKRIVFI